MFPETWESGRFGNGKIWEQEDSGIRKTQGSGKFGNQRGLRTGRVRNQGGGNREIQESGRFGNRENQESGRLREQGEAGFRDTQESGRFGNREIWEQGDSGIRETSRNAPGPAACPDPGSCWMFSRISAPSRGSWSDPVPTVPAAPDIPGFCLPGNAGPESLKRLQGRGCQEG